MKFKNPDIKSSYKESQMGKVLYDAVLETNAKKIIDFGLLNGYSAVCMAMAAKLTGGMVYAYDLFDDYEFNKANIETLKKNFIEYNVKDFIKIKKVDFYDWLKNIEDFDVLHLDISNDGSIISKLHSATKDKDGQVFFEGGSKGRDRCDWMLKYNKEPISGLSEHYDLIASSTYKTNARTYYPCISRLNK